MGVYSISGACMVKSGIENFITNNAPDYFYDWQRCDLVPFVNSLTNFIPSEFFRNGYVISNEGQRVKELHTGFSFQKEFETTNNIINEDEVDDTIEIVRKKYLEAHTAFFNDVSTDANPILIRYANFNNESVYTDIDSYEHYLRTNLDKVFKKYKLVIMSSYIDETRYLNETLLFKITKFDQRALWRADKNEWMELIKLLKLN